MTKTTPKQQKILQAELLRLEEKERKISIQEVDKKYFPTKFRSTRRNLKA